MKTKGLLSVPDAMINVAPQHRVTTTQNVREYNNTHSKNVVYKTRMTVKPGISGILCVDLERKR